MAGTKKFAVFDVDGTLIRWQLYHSLADKLAQHGYIAEDIYQKMREARMQWKRRESSSAFSDYEWKVVQAFDSALKTISPEQFNQAVDETFQEYKDQAYTYTRELITKLRAEGYFLLAISGSPVEIVSKIADYYSFDDCRGSKHYYKEGRFTGAKRVVAYRKHEILAGMIAAHGLVIEDSIGLGDTKSDIPVLEMVEHPIAFNPASELFEHAKSKGWKVVLERKNIIYELNYQDGKYQLATPN